MSEVPTTTSTQYSVSLTVRLENRPGILGRLTTAIGEAGGNIFAIENMVARGPFLERSIVVNCAGVDHQGQIIAVVDALDGIELSLIHI